MLIGWKKSQTYKKLEIDLILLNNVLNKFLKQCTTRSEEKYSFYFEISPLLSFTENKSLFDIYFLLTVYRHNTFDGVRKNPIQKHFLVKSSHKKVSVILSRGYNTWIISQKRLNPIANMVLSFSELCYMRTLKLCKSLTNKSGTVTGQV